MECECSRIGVVVERGIEVHFWLRWGGLELVRLDFVCLDELITCGVAAVFRVWNPRREEASLLQAKAFVSFFCVLRSDEASGQGARMLADLEVNPQ
jgi:hypothetical protein